MKENLLTVFKSVVAFLSLPLQVIARRDTVTTIAILTGLGLVTWGIHDFSSPLSKIFAGIMLVLAAWEASRV